MATNPEAQRSKVVVLDPHLVAVREAADTDYLLQAADVEAAGSIDRIRTPMSARVRQVGNWVLEHPVVEFGAAAAATLTARSIGRKLVH